MSVSDEYQPKKTFEVLYACQSTCVGMGIDKPSFRGMSLPIEIMGDYTLFFKDKGTPTYEDVTNFLSHINNN
jgi:hypothetical protein